jgi:hypothetical protein
MVPRKVSHAAQTALLTSFWLILLIFIPEWCHVCIIYMCRRWMKPKKTDRFHDAKCWELSLGSLAMSTLQTARAVKQKKANPFMGSPKAVVTPICSGNLGGYSGMLVIAVFVFVFFVDVSRHFLLRSHLMESRF